MSDIKIKQLQSYLSVSVKKLEEVLSVMPIQSEQLRLLAPQAMYRRVSVCFFVFLNYVCAQLELDQASLDAFELHEILNLAIEKGIIHDEDADEAAALTGIYRDLRVYDEEYTFIEEDLLKEIRRVHNFLERFRSDDYGRRIIRIDSLNQAEL